MLIEHISLPERPDRNRSATIGASEIGKCARMLAHDRSGTPKEKDRVSSGFAERGHWMEKWWVARLRESEIGYKIRYAGAQQRTLNYGPISATPDAIYDNAYTADCKSIDPRVGRIPKPEHVIQVRLTARIAQEAGLISDGGGVLTYIDASDYSNKQEFVLPAFDDGEFESSIARAHAILSSEPNSLPREGWITGGEECRECPFRGACLGEKIEQVQELTTTDALRVAELRAVARESKAKAEEQETASKRALDEILQILRAHRTRRAKGLAYIRRGASGGGLDTEAMAADGIDLSLYRREPVAYETVILEKE